MSKNVTAVEISVSKVLYYIGRGNVGVVREAPAQYDRVGYSRLEVVVWNFAEVRYASFKNELDA